MLILESSVSYPAHVPTLILAEHDILDAIKRHPGNAEHHTLLSLIHYLRRDPLYAKQQANIADKINPGNGMAMILYGLTIGKTPQAGTSFIKKGLADLSICCRTGFSGVAAIPCTCQRFRTTGWLILILKKLQIIIS